jgi:hypothetical protein
MIACDFLQLDRGVAEFVRSRERAVRPAERNRRDGGLRQQLGQEDEFALVRFGGIENALLKQRAYCGSRR